MQATRAQADRIRIVEDDPDLARLIAKHLGPLASHVQAVGNGAAAG